MRVSSMIFLFFTFHRRLFFCTRVLCVRISSAFILLLASSVCFYCMAHWAWQRQRIYSARPVSAGRRRGRSRREVSDHIGSRDRCVDSMHKNDENAKILFLGTHTHTQLLIEAGLIIVSRRTQQRNRIGKEQAEKSATQTKLETVQTP